MGAGKSAIACVDGMRSKASNKVRCEMICFVLQLRPPIERAEQVAVMGRMVVGEVSG